MFLGGQWGFWGASGFSDSLAPHAPGPVVATVQCQGLHNIGTLYKHVVDIDYQIGYVVEQSKQFNLIYSPLFEQQTEDTFHRTTNRCLQAVRMHNIYKYQLNLICADRRIGLIFYTINNYYCQNLYTKCYASLVGVGQYLASINVFLDFICMCTRSFP